jgi:hypothetical protein
MSTTKGVMVTLSQENGNWKMETGKWKLGMAANDFESLTHISRFLSYQSSVFLPPGQLLKLTGQP